MCDIRVAHVTTAEIRVEWQTTDNASDYIYHLYLSSVHGANQTNNSSHRAFTFRGLTPGTLYNITIVPEVKGVLGHPGSILQYTRECLRRPSWGCVLLDFDLEGGKEALAKGPLFLGSRSNAK